MKMIQGIFAASPPVKRGRNIDSVEFTETLAPQRLESLRPDFSTIAGALRLVQEMVNAISEEIARGEANPQPFHPYIIPNYHERPRLPRITAHVTAYNGRKAKTKERKNMPYLPNSGYAAKYAS